MNSDSQENNLQQESITDFQSLKRQANFPILIIDDDKMIQKVLKKYLENWGFNIISTLDPYEGVALAVKYRPHLIILDVYLPELNGEYLLKLMKKIELTQDIPIIIISANLDLDLLNATYKAGASEFLSKPFTQEDLLNKLKRVLSPVFLKNIKVTDIDLINENII